MEHAAGVRIDQWIVIGGVGLDFDVTDDLGEAVDDRPHVLRHAAQRVPVLDQRARPV
jgi:hypothetical protein